MYLSHQQKLELIHYFYTRNCCSKSNAGVITSEPFGKFNASIDKYAGILNLPLFHSHVHTFLQLWLQIL